MTEGGLLTAQAARPQCSKGPLPLSVFAHRSLINLTVRGRENPGCGVRVRAAEEEAEIAGWQAERGFLPSAFRPAHSSGSL